jgi:hypothetical protein
MSAASQSHPQLAVARQVGFRREHEHGEWGVIGLGLAGVAPGEGIDEAVAIGEASSLEVVEHRVVQVVVVLGDREHVAHSQTEPTQDDRTPQNRRPGLNADAGSLIGDCGTTAHRGAGVSSGAHSGASSHRSTGEARSCAGPPPRWGALADGSSRASTACRSRRGPPSASSTRRVAVNTRRGGDRSRATANLLA